ncbi:type VI secretion system amidase effector protein Tae4 [Denitromonas halophila]|nr:type VI secretion system amidase effector protein Tae4 [Denitromonas halophila]
MATSRPTFSAMWANFSTIYGDGKVTTVGAKIGGKVAENIDIGVKDPNLGFTNACALRMSYSLNYSGTSITRGTWKTVSGADKKWYIYRVRDLIQFLTETLGRPDKVVRNPKLNDFNGEKGILVFDVNWSDATGHATLWNGSTCSDHCYFPVAAEASIWYLD